MPLVRMKVLILMTITSSFLVSAQANDNSLYQLTLKELMNVKVITVATGDEKTLAQAPSVASVISAGDIKTMGAQTLAEVLNTIPGLHVSPTSQIMGPKYLIRGINTRLNPQVLMMVDNVPITSVVRGDRHVIWGYFPLNSVARIEVIRGPGSALHGADAFSGIIHVITKEYQQSTSELGARIGSFNTRQYWATSDWIHMENPAVRSFWPQPITMSH